MLASQVIFKGQMEYAIISFTVGEKVFSWLFHVCTLNFKTTHFTSIKRTMIPFICLVKLVNINWSYQISWKMGVRSRESGVGSWKLEDMRSNCSRIALLLVAPSPFPPPLSINKTSVRSYKLRTLCGLILIRYECSYKLRIYIGVSRNFNVMKFKILTITCNLFIALLVPYISRSNQIPVPNLLL